MTDHFEKAKVEGSRSRNFMTTAWPSSNTWACNPATAPPPDPVEAPSVDVVAVNREIDSLVRDMESARSKQSELQQDINRLEEVARSLPLVRSGALSLSGTLLDQLGIAIRAGHHCAMPSWSSKVPTSCG